MQSNKEEVHGTNVPVRADLTPRNRQQYSVGGGYGTDTGFRGSLGWDWRYLTQSGHQFSALIRASQVQDSVQAIYSIPGANPMISKHSIYGNVLENDYPRGHNRVHRVGANTVHTEDLWKRTLFLNYELEDYKIDKQPNRTSTLLIPGFLWDYVRVDDHIYTNEGQRINVRIQAASDKVASDTSLLQVWVHDKYVWSFLKNERLILRGDIGYTVVHDWKDQLPLSMSFFAGGSQSVRGYTYQSLGPGRYLLVGSAEVQHNFTEKIAGAIFYDTGNAFNSFPDANNGGVAGDFVKLLGSLKDGAGVGLVLHTPVGPINLSVAKAYSEKGHPVKFHFIMGPDL